MVASLAMDEVKVRFEKAESLTHELAHEYSHPYDVLQCFLVHSHVKLTSFQV